MFRVIFLLSLFLVSLYAKQVNEGIDYLNTLRSNAGLLPLSLNNNLTKSASLHAKYLVHNQTTGHYEKKGKYSYSANTPSGRAMKAGYGSAVVMENISINAKDDKNAIGSLFSAIYHRFVFLTLDKDEIGFGTYYTKKKRRVKESYVYNIGSSKLSKLCKEVFILQDGMYYMKDVCKSVKKMIPQHLFKMKKDEIRERNINIVLYPYSGQTSVYPAFYNESPDPLPNYNVSGFPISVQFNPSFYTTIKLTSFHLYNEEGKEIKKTKILKSKNDPNHLFSKYEFALMPLARLEFDTKYTAVFEAKADGKNIKKQWSFRTQSFKETLYRLNQNKSTITAKKGSTIILYMVPNHRKDLLKGYTSKGNVKATFIDQNTLRVTLPKRKSSGRVSLKFSNKKEVSFKIE